MAAKRELSATSGHCRPPRATVGHLGVAGTVPSHLEVAQLMAEPPWAVFSDFFESFSVVSFVRVSVDLRL